MDAVVLAAGQGTRLRPLTDEKPKGMVEVADDPLLTHCFDTLIELGAERFVVVVGYEKDVIVDHYGDEYRGRDVVYAEQETQDGLATAVLQAEPYVSDEFMLMLGDVVFDGNLEDVLAVRDSETEGSILVEEVPREEASRYGVCELNDDGEVVGIVEKPDDPPSNLVASGFYAFTESMFDACAAVEPSDRGEYELSDAIEDFMASNTVEPVVLDGWRVDVGYPEDRDKAEELLEADDPVQTQSQMASQH